MKILRSKQMKNEITIIFKIAMPLVAALLAERGMQFIDTMMMGWLGATALAAGALGTALFVTAMVFSVGVLSCVGIFIVRAKVCDSRALNLNLQHGIYLALAIAFPCMLFLWFVPYFLARIGENSLVMTDTVLLLHSMVWGFPALLLFFVLREFLSAFSLTFIVMLISLVALPLTFAANYILIYGKFHLPALGIAGIGYGAAFVMWFMFVGLLVYCFKHPLVKDHVVVKQFKFDREIFTDMLSTGMPIGLLFLLALLMGYFGVTALAAHQIALLCVNIAYSLPLGLAIATSLRIGHAAAAKNLLQVKKIALIIFGIVLFTSACMAVFFVLSAHFLVKLFLEKQTSHYAQVQQLATTFINIAAFFLCFDALQSVASGTLRGLKDTFVPMLLSIACYWVLGFGSAYYLSMYTQLGARGIWYGLTIGLGSTALVLILRFFNKVSEQSL
jgi:MATE family multidrug resistance protein